MIGWVEGEEDVEGEEPEGDGGRGGGRGSRDQPDEILRERFGEVAGYDEEEQPVTAPMGGEVPRPRAVDEFMCHSAS